MNRVRALCLRIYSHPAVFAAVLLLTALATYYRVRGEINGHALAHWLMTYEEGFIKRGLMGSIFQLRAVSDLTGITLETWYWFWVNAFLVLLYLGILLVLWKIYKRSRQWAYAIAPFYMAGPLLLSNTSFIGYFDQQMALMSILAAFLLLKDRPLWAVLASGIAIFIHENALLFIVPLYLYWVLLRAWVSGDLQAGRYQRIWRESLWLILPIVCFVGVFFYYEQMMSLEEKADYIARTIAPYDAFKRGPTSIIRTLTSTYSEWWASEHEAFLYRMSDNYAFLVVLFPLLFMSTYIASTLTSRLSNRILLWVIIYVLMISPLSIFMIAFDVYRFWMFPLVPGLLFVYLLLYYAPVRQLNFRWLQWGMLLPTLVAILALWPYRDVSLATRCVWYLPLFCWYACYLVGMGAHEADSAGQAERGH